MKTPRSLESLLSIAIAALMVFSASMQLLGDLWFQAARKGGEGGSLGVESVKRSLEVQPDSSFYWFSIGREFQDRSLDRSLSPLERRHLLEEARRYLEKAISLEPSASLYHYRLGWVFASLIPYLPSAKEQAHRAFSRATLLNPTSLEIRRGAGDYYLNLYGLFQAVGSEPESERDWARKNFQRHFRALLTIQPYLNTELVLERCFAVTQAYGDLEGLIPDQPSHHVRFAQFLSKKGMWESAKREFERAISLDPKDPRAYDAYASALFVRKRYEEAVTFWKKQQRLSPRAPRSYQALANALWALDRKNEAIAQLERLVSLYPYNTSYRLTLAARLAGAGKSEKALDVCREALKSDRGNPKIYARMAGYLAQQGDTLEAIQSLRRAISLSPSTVSYRDQLARLYFDQKRYARAIDEWREVLEQDSKHRRALLGIARSYEQLGLGGDALRYYRQALSLKPDDPSVLRAIERIEKAVGQKKLQGSPSG